jgi:hypothetical protein
MGANTVADDFSSFAPDDPDAIQQNVTQGQNALWARSDAAGRYQQMISNGRDNAVGNPLVNKARTIQDQFKSILEDVNGNAPDNEDPIDAQLRTNKALATGMIATSPQMAMQAAQNAVRLEQAKDVRRHLTAESASLEQATAASAAQQDLNRKLGTVVFAKQGKPDANGLPTGLVAAATLDPNDPDFAKKALQIRDDAAKAGDQVIPMTGDKFFNSKDNTAAIRGQYALAAAQERTRQALLVAQQKAQAGQMTGREYMMTSRIVSAADLGSAALANVVELPIGSNTGVFGIGQSPGHSVVQSTGDSLRNRLAPQDVQSYNTTISGLTRNLAAIESAGLMPQGSLTESMNSIVFRSGDTELTVLRKLAETRQIIERGVQATLNNPRLPESVRGEVQESLARAAQAVPFTVHDVTELQKQSRGGKKVSINDVIQQRMTTNAPRTPASDADVARVASARDAIAKGADPAKVKARLGPQLAGQL